MVSILCVSRPAGPEAGPARPSAGGFSGAYPDTDGAYGAYPDTDAAYGAAQQQQEGPRPPPEVAAAVAAAVGKLAGRGDGGAAARIKQREADGGHARALPALGMLDPLLPWGRPLGL